jgi:PAS domain-containing protein
MTAETPDWLAQMEGVLETLNEGVLIADEVSGRIVFVNECFERMTATPRAEICGRTRDTFYSGDDLAFLEGKLPEARS